MNNKDTDNKYELFVLEQVKRYGDMYAITAKVYVLLSIACVVMGILGIILHRSIVGSIIIALWSLGFMAAKRFSEANAESIKEAAVQIQAAIDDPDFDIPDDYPEDIMSLRDLVCPTLKNIRSQIIAYSILAATLWIAAVFLLMVAFASYTDPELWMIMISVLLAGMAVSITILAVRAFRDLPAAKAYDRYLYEDDREQYLE